MFWTTICEMFETSFDIGPADLQPQYQHVNHAHILTLFERTRGRYLDYIGQPLGTLIESGYFIVVTRIEVDYLREVLAGQIRVTCEDGRFEGKSLKLVQRLYNHRGKEACRASIELKAIGREQRMAVPFPHDFIQAFDAGAGSGSPSNR